MILLTAAAISGRQPGREGGEGGRRPPPPSSQSRKPPTVRCGDGGEGGRVVGVEDQPRDLVLLRRGSPARSRKRASGRSASAICAATRSVAVAAARPASTSPERSGRGAREQGAQVGEDVSGGAERVGVGQDEPPGAGLRVRAGRSLAGLWPGGWPRPARLPAVPSLILRPRRLRDAQSLFATSRPETGPNQGP